MLDVLVHCHEEIDRRHAIGPEGGKRRDPLIQRSILGRANEVRRKVGGEPGVVRKGESVCFFVDEEIKRINHRHVGN